MYQVDDKDRVEVLLDVLQSSVGAPIPIVLADEHRVVLAYYMEKMPAHWTGPVVQTLDPDLGGEPIALVRFNRCTAHIFGPPNDEAFEGHPLADRGLHPYGAFRVTNSSWIRILERRNSVHPAHRPETFGAQQHLIFSFHDSTFECVCREFDTQLGMGSLISMLPKMAEFMDWSAG